MDEIPRPPCSSRFFSHNVSSCHLSISRQLDSFVRDTERGVFEPEFLRGELVHNGLIVESKDDRRGVPGLHQKNHGPRANPWLIVASSSALRRVDRAVPLGNGMRIVHSLNLCDDARWYLAGPRVAPGRVKCGSWRTCLFPSHSQRRMVTEYTASGVQ